METILIHTDETKAKGIKQFLRAFGVTYKTKKENKEKPYNPEFVKKVLEASNEEGSIQIDPANPWKSLGLT